MTNSLKNKKKRVMTSLNASDRYLRSDLNDGTFRRVSSASNHLRDGSIVARYIDVSVSGVRAFAYNSSRHQIRIRDLVIPFRYPPLEGCTQVKKKKMFFSTRPKSVSRRVADKGCRVAARNRSASGAVSEGGTVRASAVARDSLTPKPLLFAPNAS